MTSQSAEAGKHDWGKDPRRAPLVEGDDQIIYDEHGRDYPSLTLTAVVVCHCSHWFRVVKHKHGGYALLVEHGGGREQIELAYEGHAISAIANLSSDERFHLLSFIHKVNRQAEEGATRKADFKWRKAIADKRIIRRKIRGQDAYTVGMKPEGGR